MLDYNTRKELEESWLLEMAYTKAYAEDICKKYSHPFMMHLCKCFLFYNSQWYSHWLKECGNFCIKCDNIRLKPKAKRPDMDFFMQDDFICEEIETAQDMKGILDLAISSCPEIDREEATNNEALSFLDLWNNLREELADYFTDEDTFDRSTYMEIIDNAIKEDYLDRE